MNQPFVSGGSQYIVANNDRILIHQRKYYQDPCSCCSPLPPNFISYNYTAPTPILESRGLSPSVLRQEISSIEARANQIAADNSRPSDVFRICGVISLIMMFIGIVWFAIVMGSMSYGAFGMWLPAGLIGLGCVVGIFSGAHNGQKRRLARDLALDAVRHYVEIELNEKYQKTTGIRWTIVESQDIYVTKNARTGATVSTNTIPYYNIGISCVAAVPNMVINNNVTERIFVVVNENINENEDQQQIIVEGDNAEGVAELQISQISDGYNH